MDCTDGILDTISLLNKPLKVGFNITPTNLSAKQIDEKYENMYIDNTVSMSEKLHILIKLAIFTKEIALDEIVKGLNLLHKTDLNYYNKVLKQYT